MDRTLIKKNTASLYTQYRRDRGEASYKDSLQVASWVFQYTLGLANAEAVAKKALGIYKGTPESEMVERCRAWFPEYVLPHLTDVARQVVNEHQQAGEVLAIVTGSTRYAARPLGDELGIEHLITSEMAIDERGCFSGDVVLPLCLGRGKLERTRAFLSQMGVELGDTTFYSDSITDLPLLEAVGNPQVVNPDFRLAREARRRGWPVLLW